MTLTSRRPSQAPKNQFPGLVETIRAFLMDPSPETSIIGDQETACLADEIADEIAAQLHLCGSPEEACGMALIVATEIVATLLVGLYGADISEGNVSVTQVPEDVVFTTNALRGTGWALYADTRVAGLFPAL